MTLIKKICFYLKYLDKEPTEEESVNFNNSIKDIEDIKDKNYTVDKSYNKYTMKFHSSWNIFYIIEESYEQWKPIKKLIEREWQARKWTQIIKFRFLYINKTLKCPDYMINEFIKQYDNFRYTTTVDSIKIPDNYTYIKQSIETILK